MKISEILEKHPYCDGDEMRSEDTTLSPHMAIIAEQVILSMHGIKYVRWVKSSLVIHGWADDDHPELITVSIVKF